VSEELRVMVCDFCDTVNPPPPLHRLELDRREPHCLTVEKRQLGVTQLIAWTW